MQALRLNEVIQRVVRWHNRHPLARRINAAQVHSIGEVVLPFAADRPWSAPGAALRAPTGALPSAPEDRPAPGSTEAAGPRAPHDPTSTPQDEAAATQEAPLAEGLDLQALADDLLAPDAAPSVPTEGPSLADDPAEPAEPAQAADPADAPPVPDLSDDDAASQALLAAHEAALGDPAEPLVTPHQADDPVAEADPAPALAAAPEPESAPTPRLADVVGRRAAARTAAAAASPRAPRQWWAKLCQALRGRPADMPRLKAAFSRNVFWPSSPATVARWAQRHAQAHPLAPDDWPHRVVEIDPAAQNQLRRQGQVHGIALHALTAAIGVGDRRIRLLMGADGNILGPRAYSRPRAASASAVLLVGLLGLGWGLRPPGAATPEDAPALAALAASAASAPVAHLQAAASAAPAASEAASGAAMAQAMAADPAASAATLPDAAPASAAVALASAAPVAEAPPTASAPLGRIRPGLSDEDKLAAKTEADRLRAGPAQATAPAPAPAAAPVYAVVSQPNRERRVAMNHLTVMRRAGGRLPPPAPDHGELMLNQGEWRAAWWPFATLADAERARVMLAERGLRAEVVEF